MGTSIRYALGLCCAGMLVSADVAAQVGNFNVSLRATGVYSSVNWNSVESAIPIPCASACQYASISTAGTSATARPLMEPDEWPAPRTPMMTNPPALIEADPTPQGQVVGGSTYFYGADFWEYAGISFKPGDATVSAAVFKDGEAAGVFSYQIRVTHNQTTPGHYFVDFAIPRILTERGIGYALIPGSNGGTYLLYPAYEMFTRAGVDVLVDGLPVWSSESVLSKHDGYGVNKFDVHEVQWGETSDQRARLYLGVLAAGDTFDVDFIARTTTRADAPKCGTETVDPLAEEKMVNCNLLGKTLDFDTEENGQIKLQVYRLELEEGR